MAEDRPTDSHFGQLEHDLARVAHDAGTDLDQTGLNACEGPVSDFVWQLSALQEVAKAVSQSMELKPDLVAGEPLARQARPVDCIFAYAPDTQRKQSWLWTYGSFRSTLSKLRHQTLFT